MSLDKQASYATFKTIFNSISHNKLKWFQWKFHTESSELNVIKPAICEEGICKRCKTDKIAKVWKILDKIH